MPTYEVNTTYEPFSNEPEYIESNRQFVKTMDLSATRRLLDLACGTGLMTELALEAKPDLHVVGLDISHESMLLAEERFAGLRARCQADFPVDLLLGSADRIPTCDLAFAAVIMGNAIHMLSDHNKLLAEIHRVLRPGGFLAFNSSFYAGTFADGTEKFYHDWIKLALQYVTKKSMELRRQGKPGIPRKRGTVSGAFSNPWLSIDQWTAALDKNGFDVTGAYQRTVLLTAHSFRTIGAYGGFAEVLLSGYPVHEASEALQATAEPAMTEHGADDIPRYWLEIIAVRK